MNDTETIDGEELLRRIEMKLCNVSDEALARVGEIVLGTEVTVNGIDEFEVTL